MSENNSNPVTLALGGGGAKGVAHIGVLRAIHEQNLSVAAITGTSIGAIWGAIFSNSVDNAFSGLADAQQRAIRTVEQLAYRVQFRRYIDPDWLRVFTKGIVKGDRFESWLNTMLWRTEGGSERRLTFRDLRFPLTVTTTCAATGETIVCNRQRTPEDRKSTRLNSSH